MQAITSAAIDLHLRGTRQRARRRLAATTAHPARYQQMTLLHTLAANAATTYGRGHRFGAIRTAAEFQDAVPINTYEELRPYVARIADGSDPHALTGEPVLMFTTTSGTINEPKLIPVTASGRAAERHVSRTWAAHLIGDHPAILGGKWFYLFNKAEEYRTPSGLWAGSNAGLMYRNTPRLQRALQAVPYEVCQIEDYESRYYVILRHLLACDLRLMVCINPSSILLLAALLRQHAQPLIRDTYTGGLRDGLALSTAQYAFFRARLPADRARGRALARVLATAGGLSPTDCWPGLGVLASWKGPGVDAFIEKCRTAFGALPFRDVGYGSSEFRTGLVLADEGSRNIPLPDNYFYEFIPADDAAPYLAGLKRPLLLDQLAVGERYLIIQTGIQGLYRYNIEDIVRVNGMVGRTPTIEFVQKSKMVTSITGEKIYETHVIEAMARASARYKRPAPTFFICYADHAAANYKLCVEYDEPQEAEDLRELLALFETTLGEVNSEYPYKRASLRLGAPEVYQLRSGSALRLVQHLGQRSVMDNQVKIPRLSREIDQHFAVFGLERHRADARLTA